MGLKSTKREIFDGIIFDYFQCHRNHLELVELKLKKIVLFGIWNWTSSWEKRIWNKVSIRHVKSGDLGDLGDPGLPIILL